MKAAWRSAIAGVGLAGTLFPGAWSVQGASAWRDDLWLGRGDFWTARTGVTVTNATASAWEGRTVAVPYAKVAPAGTRAEEIRVVDARGVQLEYGVAGGSLMIPVVCPAGGVARFEVYSGNPSAWGLADHWKKKPDLPGSCATVGALERLNARVLGAAAPRVAGDWLYRVPIRMANFSDADVASTLVSFPLREVLHATRHPSYELWINGKRQKVTELGTRALFDYALPAHSITVGYVYVREGAAKAVAAPVAAASALGSPIPSDQVLVEAPAPVDRSAFRALLESSVNRVKNASFEAGEEAWRKSGATAAAFSIGTNGLFGAKAAQLTIPGTVTPNWYGRVQKVPVTPGRTYFYGAFIGGDNLTEAASVHLHQHTAKGALSSGGMGSAGRGVRGTAPWTPVFGTFRAAADTAYVSLHLTLNGHGTVTHDGVVLAEYAVAQTGDPEPVAPADGTLRVAAVDPVVKVFHESPVTETPGGFRLALAQNETEALQLAVRGAAGDLEVSVEGIPLVTEISRVGYVPVDWPTAYYNCTTPEWELRHPRGNGQCDGWSGWWPDPLVRESRMVLRDGETQAFWINFTANGAAKSGVREGRIVWRRKGCVVRTDPLVVTVWSFALPARPAFPAVFDLRLNKGWEKLGRNPAERYERMCAFVAEKKMCPDRIAANPVFEKGKDGTVTADFTEYDAAATRYFDHYRFPASYMPGVFYCFGWALPPKKFLGEDPYPGAWPYAAADKAKLRPEYVRVYQQALKLYWDHVKARGWADRLTLYISDEPHFSRTNIVAQMQACCAMIHAVDPAIRIYSSTWRHCPAWNRSLDVWGVGHYGCFPVAEMSARRAAGQRLWWTTDGQMCLDTPYCAVERLLPFYAVKYGADLYEFWGSTWFTYDPWKYGWHAYIRQTDTPGKTYWVRYPDGDGYLVYPPREGESAPNSSIRLEAVRDGVEDFTCLELLAARAKADPRAAALLAEAHALVTIPNPGGRYSTRILPEPEKLGRLRARIGALLSEASSR